MNRHQFYLTAFAFGVIWYAVLSLPLSPVSSSILADDWNWPDAEIVVLMCLASLGAARMCLLGFRRLGIGHHILSGVVLTVRTAFLFGGLLTFWSSIKTIPALSWADLPMFGLALIPGMLFGGICGLIVGTMSAHIAIPTGIVAAAILRRFVDHES